jgi:parallel beta-helix repeat protein
MSKKYLKRYTVIMLTDKYINSTIGVVTMKLLSKLVISLFIFFCVPTFAYAATYYVSTTGSDTNSGTQAQPWLTIQKAADTVVAGDTVLVRGGEYMVYGKDRQIAVKNSGTPADYITIKSYPGETVTIKGDYTKSGQSAWYGIVIPGTSYIKIEGLTIKGFHAAVGCKAPGHHVIIQNNIAMYNSESGISSANAVTGTARGCDYLTIEGNTVHDNGYYENGTPAIGYYEGGGSGISIGAQGLQPYIFDTDYSHIHSIIRGNTVYHNYDGTGGSLANPLTHTDGNGIIMDMTGNYPPTLIENNIVFDNGGKCIQLFGAQNIWVTGNTCYHNATDILNTHPNNQGEITGWASPNFILKNIHIQNNIASALADKDIIFLPDIVASELSMQNNIWFGGVFRGSYSPKGSNYILTDPLFVNASVNPNIANFHLNSNSPAINNGTGNPYSASQANDFDGVFRPQGNGYDIGAYEFVSGVAPTSTPTPTGVPTPIPTLRPTATPTPIPTPTPTPLPKLGDANGDGKVDETDYGIWLSHFGRMATGGRTVGDFNVNGIVDGLDYALWLKYYGT